MVNPKSAAVRDGVILTIGGLAIYGLAHYFDVFEVMVGFLEQHEDWQADEVTLAVLTAGLMGFVYAWRRVVDLKHEKMQRTEAEEQVVWLAYHDPLTRLPNRHFLEARLADGKWGVKRPGAMIVIDLDGFKKVNDLVGHHGGDELLVEISRRMREGCPAEIIIRMGGDEFLIVSPSTGEVARVLCDRIKQALTLPLVISGLQVDVGASIGMATILPGDSLEDAMQEADLAMYAAKRQGRNSICVYDPALLSAFGARGKMEKDLRKAIFERRICSHYQPVVDLKTRDVIGFEALARWPLEDGNFVQPSAFIEIAEEAGLITELSEQLLRQACLDAKGWPGETFLAFNLSPTQLTDRLLGLRIIKILADTGLPACRLEVEVTESAVVRDLGSAMAIIKELRMAGIRVAIDDFGTGYSSLSQLANIPFDKIKIDQSFVNSFEAHDRQEKIVRSIVGLAQGLGVKTTAEGIERNSQQEHLKHVGCEQGQGYLFGRPMSAEDVVAFLSFGVVEQTSAI